MFKKQRHPDPFAHLMSAEASQSREPHLEGKDGDITEHEYVSPFRDQETVAAAQRRRMARYPTTSASSAYATAKPEELGYRKIKQSEKRAKDIQFPTYLQENERKQLVELRELEAKEAHLQYLKDSQRIYTEEELRQKSEEPAEAREPVVEEAGEVEQEGEPQGPTVEETVEAETEEPVVEEPGDAKQEGETQGPTVEETTEGEQLGEAQEPTVEETTEGGQQGEAQEPTVQETTEGGQQGEAQEPTVEETTEGGQQGEAQEPTVKAADEERPAKGRPAAARLADPLKVPMVIIPVQDHKPFLKKLFKSAPAPVPNPVASPDDPEEVVKTADGGYLTKAVYDQVSAQDQEHKQWVANYSEQQKQKYDDKRAGSNRRINSLREEIKQIKESMEELRKETDAKIDVKENELTRRLLQLVDVHVREKNKIFKETELIKKQKMSDKDSMVDKQNGVQKEITELNEQKAQAQAEYIQWSNDLADLSAHIDAKIAKLADVDRKQAKTAADIERLEKEKLSLLNEAEMHDAKHAQNTEVIEGAEKKTYLPKINEIDGQISILLTQLTSVKQQCANERAELSAITKRLEQERIAHEEKLRLEAEERKRKEEDLLGKQRQELESKAQEARLKHEEEMRKLREDYTELQNKFKEQQQEKKKALAFANDQRNATRDSSLYEYGTEEEILSV
ncbi:hypothetical protein HG536_0D05330 [Torulaspora globosa]|uniref:Uncharacterized protein n=1 Tax=Torulaspora globosa TaxID=48254 RepID=A0A7G3ZHM5_9SACH|nr:uncharacterized protein HG536_0D05330 [Torulaspora globosa]QLL33011.1 hypothetical protein HG536_0D05330 [Torulaspora globosa]